MTLSKNIIVKSFCALYSLKYRAVSPSLFLNVLVAYNIPPYSVAVGVPAKVVKARSSRNLVVSEK